MSILGNAAPVSFGPRWPVEDASHGMGEMRQLFVPVDRKRERARIRNLRMRGVCSLLLAAIAFWIASMALGWISPYPQAMKGGGLIVVGAVVWCLVLPWIKWWREYR